MATQRTTLTKSLHTVTAVANLAAYLRSQTGTSNDPDLAVRLALRILGYPDHWSLQDPTMYACVMATIRKPLPKTEGEYDDKLSRALWDRPDSPVIP